jgi:hypothetical protein
MRLPKIKLYTNEEFRAASRLEKFKMCLIDAHYEPLLNDRDTVYWAKLRRAFSLTYDLVSRTSAIQIIQSDTEIDVERLEYAVQIYKEMCVVYDDFLHRNKKVTRMALVEKLYKLADLAEEKADSAQDFKYVADILKTAGTFEGLDKPDDKNNEVRERPTKIRVTSEKRALLIEQGVIVEEGQGDDD